MSSSDRKYCFENLCFEGGGVKGFAYCGSIKALEELNILQNITRFSGASIGAFFAVMLASGFTADEILEHKHDIDFSKLKSSCCTPSIFKKIKFFGLHSLSVIENQIKKILRLKINTNITFKELFLKTGKELVIVACCLNKQREVYFHHEKFPTVKVVDALMCSMSLPFVFQPRKHDYLGSLDYYVDGGVTDNYPIWIFNDIAKLYEGNTHTIIKENIPNTTIGLKILAVGEENSRVMYNRTDKIKNILDFTKQLVNILQLQADRNNVSESYISQTIPIQISSSSIDFDISRFERNKMIENGYRAVYAYFANKDSSNL